MNICMELSKTSFNFSCWSGFDVSEQTVNLTTSPERYGVAAASTTGKAHLGSSATLTVILKKLIRWT